MSKPRLYLVTVISPALEPEHASILEAVREHSGGDFVEVFKQAASIPGARAMKADIAFTVAYLFSSTRRSNEMGFGLLDRDRYLLIEVTTYHWESGLSVARQWLDRHRTPD